MRQTAQNEEIPNNILIEYKENNVKPAMRQTHYHDYFELYYFMGERMTYFIENESYEICRGNLVFVNRMTYHRTSYPASGKGRVVISFREELLDLLSDPTHIRDAIQALASTPVMVFDGEEACRIADAVARLREAYEDKGDLFAAKLKLLDLLVYLSRCVQTGSARASVALGTEKARLVSAVVSYLNANFAQHITLDRLATSFFVNKYHLCHVFREITGVTVVEFLNRRRLTEAYTLLRTSDLLVGEIAAAVGFVNQNHFNAMFRRAYDITPSALRRGVGKK